MKFGKKVIVYLLVICMVLLMVPSVPARAEEYTWVTLQTALNGGGTITLTSNVTADAGSDALDVPVGVDVTLDLNGCTINRNLTSATSGGYVISVFGDLTIKDSVGTGKITGGNNTANGGGIFISSGGTLTLNSGTITGNNAEYGGGVHNLGTFNMTGGSITGNIASEDGGGISQYSSAASSISTNISGGTISSNEAKNGGGVYHGAGILSITGGTITENTASANGGGIYLNKSSAETDSDYSGAVISKNKADLGGGIYYNCTSNNSLLKGCNIRENTATTNGGGIYIPFGKAVAVGAGLVVSDNTVSSNANNVYLQSTTNSKAKLMLNSGSPLSSGAKIYVTLTDPSVKSEFVTSGASDSIAQYFHADVAGTHVVCSGSTMVCHNLKAVAQVAPTATTYGCKEYWQCETCSKYYSDAYGEENIDNLSTWKSTPEASGGGQLPMSGGEEVHTHTKGEYVSAKGATCTAEGNCAYYKCTGCDAYLDESGSVISDVTIPIVSDAHDWNNWEQEGDYCKRTCKNNSSHIETQAHTYGSWTTSGDGTKCTRTCSLCGAVQEQDHTLSSAWELGSNSEYCCKTCSTCGYIQKNMHDGASCSYCGWTKPHVHTLETVSYKAASCTEAGNIEYKKCTDCNKKFDADGNELTDEEVNIPATDHSYKDVVTAPTCMAQGYTTHTCTVCGNTYIDNYTEKTAHSYTVVSKVVAPSCTIGGYTVYKCSTEGCTATVNKDIVPATGHIYSVVQSSNEDKCVLKCADCDSTNEVTHTGLSCDSCGWTHIHSVNLDSCVPEVKPTCSKAGNTAYYLCNGYSKGCKAHLDASNQETNSDLAIDPDAHTYEGEWTKTENGCYRECANGCGQKQTNEHNGLSCDYCKWVHTHTWSYSSSGSQIKAGCAVNGCTQTASMSISASSIVYDGNAHTASLEYSSEFADKTGAAVGAIEYYKVDTEGATTGGTKVNEVKEVGYYYALVKVTDNTDSSKTATATASFMISENEDAIKKDNERQFGESKASAISAAEALIKDLDSKEVEALVEAAKTEIESINYDKDKSLTENNAVLNGIIETLEADIEIQRNKEENENENADSELTANKNAFEAYREDAIKAADEKGSETDSAAVSSLISVAKESINDLVYDESKTLEENKAKVDAILTELDTDISNRKNAEEEEKKAAEREALLKENKASFEEYKKTVSNKADSSVAATDSDSVKGLVVAAKGNITSLSYDENKSLEENKTMLDAIITKLEADIKAQREKEAQTADDPEPDPDPNPTPVTPNPEPVTPNPDPNPEPVTAQPIAKGKSFTDSKAKIKYQVTVSSATKGEVAYVASTNNSAKTITIPATVKLDGITYKVTSVAANAFKGNKKITKVVIGSNVKKLSSKAFYGCTSLATLKLGKNVTSIDSSAFYGCKKLKSVTLDSNLTTIGASAFYKCTALQSITVPAKVKTIGNSAFYGCKKLKTVTIKTKKLTAKTVGKNAFKGIYAGAKIKVPSSKLKAYKTLLKAKGITGKKQKITK